MTKAKDLKGEKFGRLTVIERVPKNNGHAYWKCVCECGNITIVRGSTLRTGKIQSCGCFKRESVKKRMTKHGNSNLRVYAIWKTMLQRCKDKKCGSYDRYGGRGIVVCEEWLNDFQTFYDWAMSNGYADNLSIDRIDNNKNYDPSNCRWSTAKEQSNNTRRNRLVTYNGETKTISQWADKTGISYQTLYMRIHRGWDKKRAFESCHIKRYSFGEGAANGN